MVSAVISGIKMKAVGSKIIALAFLIVPSVGVSSWPMSFLVMGDWGGNEKTPYNTPSEIDTARAINSEAESTGSKFALVLGDNFYHSGVTSVHDTRFNTTFENVFVGSAVSVESGFKFVVVAGNHDHIGDVQAQVAYSSVSPRWVFPSLYYSFTKTAEDGAVVEFVMLDTVTLAGQSQLADGTQLTGDRLPGVVDTAFADQQTRWLESVLKNSSADYLLVAGHYPVYSVCEHGPTPSLQAKVRPLLEKYKVTAFLAGHDHCSEHIDVGDGVQYHGIGSAAYHDTSEAHLHTVTAKQLKYHDAETGGGFASFRVSKSSMLITHHDGLGNKMYNSTAVPRTTLEVVV